MGDASEELADRYREAEDAFIAAVVEHQERSVLAALASAAASTADKWSGALGDDIHREARVASPSIDRLNTLNDLAEYARTVERLWARIAAAYDGRDVGG